MCQPSFVKFVRSSKSSKSREDLANAGIAIAPKPPTLEQTHTHTNRTSEIKHVLPAAPSHLLFPAFLYALPTYFS